ncbi:hypothetical protein BKA56DRAFT_291878 [Ilyonectria sp. MPI-CAGE-AT-0026]|nr:hypothetical protein BKA56DRAFT_291878 [Ilyonectria sp. MPI-CAGE-AT-0026]
MSRPAHSPAGIATHQSPTAQGPRGSRGPLAGEPEGSCRGGQRRGRDLASTFPGPLCVAFKSQSSSVDCKNRPTVSRCGGAKSYDLGLLPASVCPSLCGAREEGRSSPSYTRTYSIQATTLDWRPGGSVRLGRRGPNVTKSCRDRHGATWRRTYLHSRYIEGIGAVPHRHGAERLGPLATVPGRSWIDNNLRDGAFIPWGGGDLCDLLACWPCALLR